MPRKPIELDWNVVEALCSVRCTKVEIAATLKVSEDTVDRCIKRKYRMTFSEYYDKHSATGTIALRRKQFQLALSGNPTMLIWLGKQTLGQTEKATVKQELSGLDGGPVEVKVDVNELRKRLASRITSISARLGTGIGTPESN